MDISWINGRLFSKEHIDGVSDFMKFVRESFGENEEILCPCRRCLNRMHRPQAHVEDHLYIYGMANTYNRWIHHGEPFDAGVHENAEHLNEHISGQEDASFDENKDSNDRIPEMIQELHNAEDHGGGQALFASLIEELKHELYPGCAGYTRFSFVVKLLHIKSFYQISNVGIKSSSKKSSRGSTSLQVQELQAELETEKQGATELRLQIDAQQQELDTMKMQAHESETAMAKQSDEIESLKKITQETNALLRQLLSFNQGQLNPTP